MLYKIAADVISERGPGSSGTDVVEGGDDLDQHSHRVRPMITQMASKMVKQSSLKFKSVLHLLVPVILHSQRTARVQSM